MITQLRQLKASQWYNIILSSAIAIFCFAPKFIGPIILVLTLFVVTQAIKKKMTFKLNSISLFFILFFACYVVGLIFSDHLDLGLKNIERRLVYLVFPVLFSFRFKEEINYPLLVGGLVVGVFVTSFLGLWNSYELYQVQHDFNNNFGSTSFSYIHHPTYFSAILLLSSWLVWLGWKRAWKYYSLGLVMFFWTFACTMEFFCFSFAGLLCLAASILYILFRLLRNLLPRWGLIILVALLPVLPFAAYKSNIHVQIQVDELLADLNSFFTNPKAIFDKPDKIFTGNEIRLIMWTVSLEEIISNPLGAGTSNFDDVLAKRLHSYGLDEVSMEQYNPHNQYLQVGVELGIIGLLVFIVLLFLCFKRAFQTKQLIWLIFLLSLCFNMLFESMLQRQSGIVFFTFWFLLFSIYPIEVNSKPIQRELK